MMVNIAICEDELIHRDEIRELLESNLKLHNVSYNIYEFKNGKELLRKYPNDLDILILDIKMDDMDGIEVARNIREFDEEVEIIFMTSYPEYMQKGYEVRAYRYLLKPIKEEDIRNNIISLIELLKVERSKYLCISTKDNIHRIAINSIVYIETERPNLIINTISSSYKSKITMKDIETYLNEYNFFRCHNSYLINLKFVEEIQKNNVIVKGKKIPLSRHKINYLKVALADILGDLIC